MRKTCSFFLFMLYMFVSCCISGCVIKDNSPKLLNVSQEFFITDSLTPVEHKKARVIMLFGQSNATGVARNEYYLSNYPEDYAKLADTISRVYIHFMTENGGNSSNGQFIPCRFGCGASADYFGPEVGIAYSYASLYPDDDIFIIKYSYGGTTLDNQWLDGTGERGELYNAAKAFSLSSISYLTSCGYDISLEGVCWMQGENDSCSLSFSNNYQKNTEKLISYLRTDFSEYRKNLPFIDAEIADIYIWPYHEIVNNAKMKIATTNEKSACLDTVNMELTTTGEPSDSPDIAHYDSESMIKLGKAFGEKLVEFQ